MLLLSLSRCIKERDYDYGNGILWLSAVRQLDWEVEILLLLETEMTPDEYVTLAGFTEAPASIALTRIDEKIIRLDHAAKGMCTETGEIQDQLKRHIFYGLPLDDLHMVEELGDLLWYVALACNTLGVSMESVMAKNIAKLMKRYPNKFTEKDALSRDLQTERKVLEES